MKDELGGTITTKFVGLWAKTYSYIKNDGSEDKKAKVQKSVSSKKTLKSYKNCLKVTLLASKTNYYKNCLT